MLRYLETSCVILAWCVVLSLLVATLTFSWLHLRHGRLGALRLLIAHQPSLIIGSVLIVIFYHSLGWVLFFPVHMMADRSEIIFKGLIPALVLLLASGLLRQLILTMSMEYRSWSKKSFLLTAKAYSLHSWRVLAKVVLWRSLLVSWGYSLPWLFGELIVVESLFNAPGLGLDIWTQARQREIPAMLTSLGLLSAIYLCFAYTQHSMNQWLGRRLEGYL